MELHGNLVCIGSGEKGGDGLSSCIRAFVFALSPSMESKHSKIICWINGWRIMCPWDMTLASHWEVDRGAKV